MPVVSASKQFLGIVGGWLDLSRSNFLVEIAHSRLGSTGFYCLVSSGAKPVYVQHPDTRQARQPARAVGDTCGEQDQTATLEFLMPERPAIARYLMSTTGWELIAVLPAREAYAPLRQMQRRFLADGRAGAGRRGAGDLAGGAAPAHAAVAAASGGAGQRRRRRRLRAPARRPQRDEIGDVTRAFIRLMRDVRQRGQQLALARRRLRAVTDNLPSLLAFIDNDEALRLQQHRLRAGVRRCEAEIRGRTVREVLGEEALRGGAPYLQQALAGAMITFESEYRTPQPHWMEMSYRPEWSEDGKQVVGVHIHVQDDYPAQAGAPAAGADFPHRSPDAAREPERLRGPPPLPPWPAAGMRMSLMALLFLDMDRFKAVNDAHGHATGDMLLQSFALRLRRCVRDQDHVARLGGDEFAVILEDIASPATAQRVAESILESIGQRFYFDGVMADVDVSIGVALYRASPMTDETLKRMADALLYRAKALGRGRYEMGPGGADGAGSLSGITGRTFGAESATRPAARCLVESSDASDASRRGLVERHVPAIGRLVAQPRALAHHPLVGQHGLGHRLGLALEHDHIVAAARALAAEHGVDAAQAGGRNRIEIGERGLARTADQLCGPQGVDPCLRLLRRSSGVPRRFASPMMPSFLAAYGCQFATSSRYSGHPGEWTGTIQRLTAPNLRRPL